MLATIRTRLLTQALNKPIKAKPQRSHFKRASSSSSRVSRPLSLLAPSTRRSPLFFLALAAVPVALVASNDNDSSANTSPSSTIEPRTGLELPTAIASQTLVGTSARSVTFLGFLTYAFALYREPRKWENMAKTDILDQLVQDPKDSTFRIVTYRTIDCTHFCSSISAGTTPRIKKMLERNGSDSIKAQETAEELASQFRALFKSKDLPATTAIDFRFEGNQGKPSGPARVSVSVNGNLEGHIDGDLFSTALVAIYFGADPKSKEIQTGIQDCLNQRKH